MDTPEIHAHPHHTGHRWVDYVLAGSAFFVSLISLWLGIQHGRAMERLVEANSWPNVELDTSVDPVAGGGVTWEIAFRNSGVGPARLQTLEVSDGTMPLRSSGDLIRDLRGRLGLPASVARVRSGSVVGSVLAARDRQVVLGLPFETIAPGAPTMALLRATNQLYARWCYCSVFDECYLADSRASRPSKVQACPVPAVPFDDDISHSRPPEGKPGE